MQKQYAMTARAVIVQNMNILLCRIKGNDWYFMPGGNVEFDEVADEALVREFKEELGADLVGMQFIGAAENIYANKDGFFHEINAVFRGVITQGGVISHEKHIEFRWLPVEELPAADLRPVALRDAVVLWLGNGQHFWVTQKG